MLYGFVVLSLVKAVKYTLLYLFFFLQIQVYNVMVWFMAYYALMKPF